ncbi:MAG: hypothetical protein PHY12_15405 [Eubacteriales bacterium]|nr:hypothetical protein [Eubacteriales bacterium]
MRKITRSAAMTAAAALLLAAGAIALNTTRPEPAPVPTEAPLQQAAASDTRVAEGCELVQTLSYTRCEHTVTRRVAAPPELTGKTLEDVKPLYDAWQITSFAPREIGMSQRPDLYCPDHYVLMSGEDGRLNVFQNKYGDALALVSELDAQLSALPAAMQEEARAGIGFDTLEALEQWLESAES